MVFLSRQCASPSGHVRTGFTLLLVILILSSLMSISLGIFDVVLGEFRISGEVYESFIALYAADQGIEQMFYDDRVKASVCSGSGSCSFGPVTVSLPNGACYVLRLNRVGSNTTVVSTGEYRCGTPALAVKRAFEASYVHVSPTAPVCSVTGGTKSTFGSYALQTFTSNGTLTVADASITADVLIVGGGNGGQNAFTGSGGNGGQVIYQTGKTIAAGTYSINVGSGGSPGGTGGNSSAFGSTATGGGGASGGGSCCGNGSNGTRVDIDGNNYYWGGGGGGGHWDNQSTCAGNGGLGGGGGGGSGRDNGDPCRGTGGGSARNAGGNGNSSGCINEFTSQTNGGNGGANTGGGGGGPGVISWGSCIGAGGTGGSGIVIVRYSDSACKKASSP